MILFLLMSLKVMLVKMAFSVHALVECRVEEKAFTVLSSGCRTWQKFKQCVISKADCEKLVLMVKHLKVAGLYNVPKRELSQLREVPATQSLAVEGLL